MKNITVSVPEDVYRLARVRAAERDTSVTALVRGFLVQLGDQPEGGTLKRQQKLLRETIESIRKAHPQFSAADRLDREAVHARDALR